MNEEEIRLDQTKKVFDTIATLIKKNETCSYRYLIYDLLGFKEKDYATLLSGMTITNKLVECETQKEVIDKIKEFIQSELDNNIDGEKSFGGYQCKIILDKLNELLEEIE